MSKTVTVCRNEHFNAAHRLHVNDWSDAKNKEVFGKCNNANFHGHNYDLTVSLTGEVDPVTGYVFDMKALSDIIREEVVDRFDHKNLNLDVEEFRSLIPSAENIAIVIHDLLKKRLPSQLQIQITLYETQRNFVIYPSQLK